MKSRANEDFQDEELSENTERHLIHQTVEGHYQNFLLKKFSNKFFSSLLHNILGTSKAISKLDFRKNVENCDAVRTVFDVLDSLIISYREANST